MTIPEKVHRGMFIAALAQAQRCNVLTTRAGLDLSAPGSYNPGEGLMCAMRDEGDLVLGVIGWAVPLGSKGKNDDGVHWGAVWWRTQGYGNVGAVGNN